MYPVARWKSAPLYLLPALLFPGWTAMAQPQPASAHVNLYFAQVADGQFDGGRWQTVLTFVNTNETPATAEIRLFGSNGGPLIVDFGAGPGSEFTMTVPAKGTRVLASRPTSLPVRSGWARVYSDVPLMGSGSFRLWLGQRAAQEVTAPPTLPVIEYASYANRDLGVAIANPNNRVLQVDAALSLSDGSKLGPARITLPPFGHTAFNVVERFPSIGSRDGMLLLSGFDPPSDEFLAWTMNTDPSGTFSSLPPGGVQPPLSHWDRIWNVYLRVLNAGQSARLIPGPAPELLILYDKQANAYAKNGAQVGIFMALSELLGDSDSELAFVVGHELGHIIQQRSGGAQLWHSSNAELDADIWGALFSLLAGYDAYAAAGSLSKLAMATGTAGLLTQLFEDLIPVADAHRSFNTRLEVVHDFLVLLCASDIGRPACQDYKRIMHPHLPDSAPLRIEELESRGFRSLAEIKAMTPAFLARLAAAENTQTAQPGRGNRD
jgi:hypothetical protein